MIHKDNTCKMHGMHLKMVVYELKCIKTLDRVFNVDIMSI